MVDLLVLTSLGQVIFKSKILITLVKKTSYLNKEVNCTESFPSVRVPWFVITFQNSSV